MVTNNRIEPRAKSSKKSIKSYNSCHANQSLLISEIFTMNPFSQIYSNSFKSGMLFRFSPDSPFRKQSSIKKILLQSGIEQFQQVKLEQLQNKLGDLQLDILLISNDFFKNLPIMHSNLNSLSTNNMLIPKDQEYFKLDSHSEALMNKALFQPYMLTNSTRIQFQHN